MPENKLEIVGNVENEGGNPAQSIAPESLKPGTMILHRDKVPPDSYAGFTVTGDPAKGIPPVTITREQATAAALGGLRKAFARRFSTNQ